MCEKPTYEELEQRIRELERAESERKQVEAALRESENKYRTIVKNAIDALYIHDFEGHLLDCNESACRMTGYTREELVGHSLDKIDSDENKRLLSERMKRLMRDDQIVFTGTHVRKDRSLLPVEVSAKVVSREGKGVIQGFVRDITERKRAEESLRDANRLLEGILEGIPDIIGIQNPDHTIVRYNRAGYEALGMTHEEVVGKPCFTLLGKTAICEKCATALSLKTKKLETVEQFVPELGRHFLCLSNPILDDAGEVSLIIEQLHDITEYVQAEGALRESEARYRSLFDQSVEGIYLHHLDGRILDVNEIACLQSGYTREELLKLTVFDLHPEDPEKATLPKDEILRQWSQWQTGHRFTLESAHQRKDGTVYPVQMSTGVIRYGKKEMMLAIVQDITERKQGEEALRASETLLAQSQQIAHVGSWQLDMAANLLSWSDETYRIFGLEPQAFAATYEAFLDAVHPEDRAAVDAAYSNSVRESKEYYEIEHRIIRKGTGEIRHVYEKCVHERDASGAVIRSIGMVQDITEHKRAEEEREKLHAQLYQAQKMEAIGSLAGGVAHDLNNLLSPILGYGEMLRDELDPEDYRRESLDEIMSAGLRARDLVRQLLAFSRKQILEFRPLNLNKVAAGLERLLRYTIREDIEMEFDLTPDAGVVMADIGQIEQVIMNLSVNAADAMPEGGKLTIETQKVYLDEEYAKHHTSVKPGEYIMLAVSDSGGGMDEATRERIFDPFFSTKGEMGTGLGLATVYGIVKQHGGNIWVYSEPGKGSTFKVYLPVVETPEPEETTFAETIKDLKGSETILVVEDSDQVRRLAESVLKRNGYHVLTAKDGAKALEAIASHDRPVNLLLTDVVLPGMNGRELYEKAAEKTPSMKVLYMSGYTDNVIAHRGVLDEGVQFIQKPFTIYGLAVKVREALDEKSRK